LIKKTELMAYANPRPSGIRAISLEDGDELIGVQQTDGNQEIVLSTAEGQAIRFKEDQVRATGRGSYGVVGLGDASDLHAAATTSSVPARTPTESVDCACFARIVLKLFPITFQPRACSFTTYQSITVSARAEAGSVQSRAAKASPVVVFGALAPG